MAELIRRVQPPKTPLFGEIGPRFQVFVFDNITTQKTCNFGGEWGRRGSPRADTLGKRSHGLQQGF